MLNPPMDHLATSAQCRAFVSSFLQQTSTAGMYAVDAYSLLGEFPEVSGRANGDYLSAVGLVAVTAALFLADSS